MNHGYEYVERLGPRAAGRSLLDWLSERYAHSSRAVWLERLARGELSLDGRVASAEDRIQIGEALVWRRPPWEEPTVPLTFAILHRDEHLLAVAKPRGLPSLPNGGLLEHTLLHRVRQRFPEASPLHRLGRGTSGLLLFTRTPSAARAVAAAWRGGQVEKVYLALASGRLERAAFTVDVPIGPVPHDRLGSIHAACANGRRAESHVQVIGERGDATLVAVRITTGRPHQIRIHLAASGHPLVGDPLYVDGGLPRADALPGEGGYWLHSWRLVLAHPADGRRLELECPPPSALR